MYTEGLARVNTTDCEKELDSADRSWLVFGYINMAAKGENV